MHTIGYPHIELNADAVPIISGTTTKVLEIVQDHLAHHWNAEDIHRQYPHLGLAQIYSALAYFYDHEQEIEQEISRRTDRVQEIRGRREDAAFQAKLRQGSTRP